MSQLWPEASKDAFFSMCLAPTFHSTWAAARSTFTACMKDVLGQKRHQPRTLSAFGLQKSKRLGESRALVRSRHSRDWAESPGEEEDALDQGSSSPNRQGLGKGWTEQGGGCLAVPAGGSCFLVALLEQLQDPGLWKEMAAWMGELRGSEQSPQDSCIQLCGGSSSCPVARVMLLNCGVEEDS